jgi:hypothetical protein
MLVLGSAAHAGICLTINRHDGAPSARQTAAMDARREITAAENDFRRAYGLALRNHPLAGEIEAARREVVKSQTELANARRDVKAKLAQQPDVRKMLIDLRILDEQIAAEKDADVRTSMAKDRLVLRKKLSAAESEAIGGDVYVTLALAGLQESTNKLRSLEQQHQSLMLQDPGFTAAKNRLDAARQRLASISG